jgi:hypothetical protein
VFLQQPGAPTLPLRAFAANQPLTASVALKDGNGATDTLDSVDQILLRVFASVNGVTVPTPTATYTVTLVRGIGSFPKFKIATPGTYFLDAYEIDNTGADVTTTMTGVASDFQIK